MLSEAGDIKEARSLAVISFTLGHSSLFEALFLSFSH